MRRSLIFYLSLAAIAIVLLLSFLIFYLEQKAARSLAENGVNNKTGLTKVDSSQAQKNPTVVQVNFQTDDGVNIVGDYYDNPAAKFVGIVAPMFRADRKAYADFCRRLQANGYSVLAIDWRGQGASVDSSKGKLNYQNFSQADFQNAIFDLEAANKFLRGKGFQTNNQFLIGSGLGANLVLKFLGGNNNFRLAVLVAPRLNDSRVKIESLIDPSLGPKLILVVSASDSAAVEAVTFLNQKMPGSQTIIYPSGNDSRGQFLDDPGLSDKIIMWLKTKLF